MLKQALTALLMLSSFSVHAILVHTSDFINDASRTNFNGFESIPNDGTFFTGGSGPYTEDGIVVEQINGDAGKDIWVTCSSCWGGTNNTLSWYPNGGDNGYTQLSLTGGIDFINVGFNYSTGSSGTKSILFELLDNGSLVLGGSASFTRGFNYLGFSGGGFDTIRMRDNDGADTVTDGSNQALTIDNIELSGASQIPEPTTLALMSLGLAGLGFARKKKRHNE